MEEAIYSTLCRFTDKQLILLILYYGLNKYGLTLKQPEIAEFLGVSTPTIQMRHRLMMDKIETELRLAQDG